VSPVKMMMGNGKKIYFAVILVRIRISLSPTLFSGGQLFEFEDYGWKHSNEKITGPRNAGPMDSIGYTSYLLKLFGFPKASVVCFWFPSSLSFWQPLDIIVAVYFYLPECRKKCNYILTCIIVPHIAGRRIDY